MRLWLPLLVVTLGCGAGPKKVVEEPPPPPLGPEEIGPVPPELKHVETDAYSADIEAPPTAAVKEKVQATVIVRAKAGLEVSSSDDWRLVTKAPSDVNVTTPVLTKTSARLLKNSVTYLVTIVPLRAGVRHVTFKLGGSVCDEQFCDVVGDQLSWNLEVK